ncbi:hypothetical protein [Bifidobacterium pseudocatenulatum]|uniref:hypothetical protein n=1 Tax=Bifidobacterium pseudocatenulatum TaxID=28026 RepID=UPI003D15B72F
MKRAWEIAKAGQRKFGGKVRNTLQNLSGSRGRRQKQKKKLRWKMLKPTSIP